MKDVFREILRAKSRGERSALSTIINSKGSLPMSSRSKMLVLQDGTIVGTVGGGCLEADVWAEAKDVMKQDVSRVSRFILTEKHAGENGLNCGGTVDFFTEPIVPGRMDDVFEEIVRLRDENQSVAIATIISDTAYDLVRDHSKMLIRRDGSVVGTLGGGRIEEEVRIEGQKILGQDLLKIMNFTLNEEEAKKLNAIPGTILKVFIESLLAQPVLYLFGGGHVSLQIARVAKIAGFKLVVIEDRPMFGNKERFPEADDIIIDDFTTIAKKLEFNESSYLVAVTRGHQHDEKIIEQVVGKPARYIGMIGSKRKIKLMWDKLQAKGISKEWLEKVHAPIGLDIGADNPGEIAVSIVAELIKIRRGGARNLRTVEESK
jgi:xanthine dehydrogenase accessory factor